MKWHRTFLLTAAGLLAALSYACGGGSTDPAAPPPPTASPRATTVTVTPATTTLTAIGQSAQLVAEVLDQAGRKMDGVPVTWSSEDTLVAVVGSAGMVTSVGRGTASVVAKAGEASGEAMVRVMQSPRSVTVSPSAAVVALGDTLRLVAEAFDENGHRVEEAVFVWTSNTPSVGTVDSSGLVRGVVEGTATITAQAGEARGTSEITVENPDRAALAAFYEATQGPNWVNHENWLTDAPLGEWFGVVTDQTGRVVRMAMSYRDASGRWISNNVSGRIPPELGDLTALEHLQFFNNNLAGSIPPELGRLTRLRSLDFSSNDLSGPIPPELGNLGNLERLSLRRNDLSGPIPESFLRIDGLERFYFEGNADACAPGTIDFVAWLDRIDDASGPYCNEADEGVLTLLYETSGGPAWANSSGWIETRALDEWYGVGADSLGRVVTLDLTGNGLEGQLPAELGSLAEMTVLRLGNNQLSGRLPLSLTRVSLREFDYTDTELCEPRAAPFREWLAGIPTHEGTGVDCMLLPSRAVLEVLYETTNGPNWKSRKNWLTDAPLAEWHGVTTNGEGQVTGLRLSDNGLEGSIPPELGDLSELEVLDLRENFLSGPLPAELGNLPTLRYLGVGRTTHWLRSHGFRANLEPSVPPPYPVLTGPIPPEFGNLSNLETLDLGLNYLTGPIPPELGNLSRLGLLRLESNGLSGPIPPELGRLSGLKRLLLSWNALENSIPLELGELSGLEILDLGGNFLSGSIPSELGNLSKLRYLSVGRTREWVRAWGRRGIRWNQTPDTPLSFPALTGSIPVELGNLPDLETLDLGVNNLTGPIPVELGNLSRLGSLRLEINRLSGPIPPELGRLSGLVWLMLSQNALEGTIPPALGRLGALERLSLSRNALTGPLPSEFGGLTNLKRLDLEYNGLSGALPPELGELAELTHLILSFNDLSGPVPATFGGLESLRMLGLTNNAALSGALPGTLTAIEGLVDLAAAGTGLCAPAAAEFSAWLAALNSAHVAPCDVAPAEVYLTQAVQSRDIPVPLVAGDDALVRVFPTAANVANAPVPPVRVRFYVEGRETHIEEIPGKQGPLPAEVDEGSLHTSANALIPGDLIRPGLEVVVEIDPDGTLDPSWGVAKRIPDAGRLSVDVRALPQFHLTIVPFLWSEQPDSAVVDIAREMAEDALNHELLWKLSTLLPIADGYDLTVHDPVLVSSRPVTSSITRETEALRVLEGSDRYHLGMWTGEGSNTRNSNTGRRTISTYPQAGLAGHIAHEFGHTMRLLHAPGCFPGSRDAFVDPSYPYSTGIAGVWGYDFREGGTLVQPSRTEVMASCGGWSDGWISDYHFNRALRHRMRYDAQTATAAPSRSLLLWGGVDEAGVPFLDPALVVDAPPVLPDSAGEHRITGRASGGGELFSFTFAMPADPHGEDPGPAGFVFALPVRPGWVDALASITLSGPEGTATLDGSSYVPLAILRDRSSGQVRGFLRGSPATTLARSVLGAAVPLDPDLEVLFSRGLPRSEAWQTPDSAGRSSR